jgi:hypothetical protein
VAQFIIGYDAFGNPIYAPNSPGITKTINSYLYWEYSDDDDLQALVAAYNVISQQYLDWFNALGLPIYSGPVVAGALLDWVGVGLYGYPRPVLPSGRSLDKGAINTYQPGYRLAIGTIRRFGPTTYFATNDDVYRRCLTWHFWKGDGKYFAVRWLKRRVMRFLTGVDGTGGMTDETYQIGVTFGVYPQATIIIYNGLRTVTGAPCTTASGRVQLSQSIQFSHAFNSLPANDGADL